MFLRNFSCLLILPQTCASGPGLEQKTKVGLFCKGCKCRKVVSRQNITLVVCEKCVDFWPFQKFTLTQSKPQSLRLKHMGCKPSKTRMLWQFSNKKRLSVFQLSFVALLCPLCHNPTQNNEWPTSKMETKLKKWMPW